MPVLTGPDDAAARGAWAAAKLATCDRTWTELAPHRIILSRCEACGSWHWSIVPARGPEDGKWECANCGEMAAVEEGAD